MTTLQIQSLLTYLGYDPGEVDGIPGRNTRQAVLSFQAAEGLETDGSPGPLTQAALLDAVANGRFRAEDANVPEETTGTFWDHIRYFTREELKCKCGGRYCNGFPAEPQELLVRLADRARAHFGAPAHNVSCLRCPTWNAKSGGVANSQHMYGEAMDIRIDGVTADQLLAFFEKQPEVRYCYKINSTNVHFDIPKGKR